MAKKLCSESGLFSDLHQVSFSVTQHFCCKDLIINIKIKLDHLHMKEKEHAFKKMKETYITID
jgi:hypothetical protein